MDFVDILVTPFFILIIFLVAFGYQTKNRRNFLVSKYFLSSFFLRISGGISFACVYAFYYGGGDTLNYHHDSIVISETLRYDPLNGLELLLSSPDLSNANTYKYIQKMIFKTDPASHFISAIAAFFNLFTFDSFLSTTIIFSLIGFTGNWQLFRTLCRLFPNIHAQLAIGCLYLPSILFWTSGIMKDTICTAAICFLFKSIVDLFVYNQKILRNTLVSLFCIWIVYTLKIYILFCFIPTIMIYIFSIVNHRIKNPLFRKIIKPIFYGAAILFSFIFIRFISEDDSKYSFEEIETTAKITAEYIGNVSLMSGGSFYSLGKLDFSITNLPILLVKSFNVTFYRPYIWEISSPLMIFSVMESIYFIYLSFLFLKYYIKNFNGNKKIFTPFTTFCFSFAVTFAFVVGVTSNNFGTLARYKSLMLPFFVCGIYTSIKQNDSNPVIIKK